MKSENIIEFENLSTAFYDNGNVLQAVNGINLEVKRGSILAVIGESGSGKSVSCLSLMQLFRSDAGKITTGKIRFFDEGVVYNIEKMTNKQMSLIRGKKISMIFQEPMTSLNPVHKIKTQLKEMIKLHTPKITNEEMNDKIRMLLEKVKIHNVDAVLNSYPHELSGGMLQRVMIAMGISANPKVLIADEPTTALDVTTQAAILELLLELRKELGITIILVTHDFGVVAKIADCVAVMYEGRIVEKGTLNDVFSNPLHPYTKALIRCQKKEAADGRLYAIKGRVQNPVNLPDVCYFKERCDECMEICENPYPKEVKISDSHCVSCHKYLQGV